MASVSVSSHRPSVWNWAQLVPEFLKYASISCHVSRFAGNNDCLQPGWSKSETAPIQRLGRHGIYDNNRWPHDLGWMYSLLNSRQEKLVCPGAEGTSDVQQFVQKYLRQPARVSHHFQGELSQICQRQVPRQVQDHHFTSKGNQGRAAIQWINLTVGPAQRQTGHQRFLGHQLFRVASIHCAQTRLRTWITPVVWEWIDFVNELYACKQ